MTQSPTMHTVTFDAVGGPEVLRWTEHRMPSTGPDEVVVRVAAATVNPT